MKKNHRIALIMGTTAFLCIAIGLCMCLLPQWNAFYEGIALGGSGILLLLITYFINRKMDGKPMLSGYSCLCKTTIYTIMSIFVFAIGMCLVMVWPKYMMYGIILGSIGILMLICLLPTYISLQKGEKQ